NMVLDNEEIVIFDGIDFNPDLRWIDVMSEVAFCTMDLTDRKRPDLARRLLNAYLEQSGDYVGVDLLPFYLTYRSLVRAKVAHLGWQQHEEEEHELRQSLTHQRQEYLDLATQYTKPGSPELLITHGLSGSGKSVGTQRVVEELGAIRVRSDVERKRLAGLQAMDNSHSSIQSDLYSSTSTEATYHRLAQAAEHIIRAGFTAILDATFLKAEQRTMMRNLAERLQVPFRILDFQASDEQLRERITRRLAEGADPSEANVEVLEYQIQNREPLTADELTTTILVNTEEVDSVDQLIANLKCEFGD
ncbi:MAG: AAA family ATPase, partial [Planctomycetaceae bacterium]|nr:AAA family ATPase [Planctomycetaceae bacterium]